jgi:hypothetical protein
VSAVVGVAVAVSWEELVMEEPPGIEMLVKIG